MYVCVCVCVCVECLLYNITNVSSEAYSRQLAKVVF